ncbi:hypothetical protein EVAR_99179_1 [Eumeta japonica]|uniref:Uncharacterized protein n=1 Tax=Eumeta variegata TaxID=151549 RepID=A0A4C1YV47_EUMVA|nr:hypothetical protein EVAR_99179_1 [Eumeta japonica]
MDSQNPPIKNPEFYPIKTISAYAHRGLNIPAIASLRQTADGCCGGRSHLGIGVAREQWCSEAMISLL